MQSTARVVIIGGGMMGCGLLYHLAEEGWTDSLLIEKGELTSGSTWHAAGQCPSFIADYNMAKVHHYGNTLYPKLEELTGHAENLLGVPMHVGNDDFTLEPTYCLGNCACSPAVMIDNKTYGRVSSERFDELIAAAREDT